MSKKYLAFGSVLVVLVAGFWFLQQDYNFNKSFASQQAVVAGSVSTLGNGLLLDYKFDETAGLSAVDSSVNGYHGTLVNGPFWVAGNTNNAVQLDGINDSVNTNQDDPLDLTGSMSISAWIYRTSNSNIYHIASKNQTGIASPWQFVIQVSGQLRSYTKTPGTGSAFEQFIDGGTITPLNAWTHVVLVRDASTLKTTFYINGVLDSKGWQTYSPSQVAASGIAAYVGARGGGGANYFKGSIDEFRIYDRAVTASEVIGLYDAIVPTTPNNITATVDSPSQITVSWDGSTDNVAVSKYDVYRDSAKVGSVAVNSYVDSGLQPDTTYIYEVVAVDTVGNSSGSSSQVSATTASGPSDTTAPVVSAVSANSVTTNAATISWTTDENSNSYVEYGPTTAYGSVSGIDESVISHTHQLVGLTPATPYHYRVRSTDSAGNPGYSLDNVFTTSSTTSIPGRVAYWRFDEGSGITTADDSGNNYTANLVNGSTWISGSTNFAVNFDAKNDFVNTNVDNPLDFTGSVTLSAWIYRGDQGKTHAIISKQEVNVTSPYQLELTTAGVVRMITRGGGSNQNISSTSVIPLTTWKHVVYVRDAATLKQTFYFDGVQDLGGWKSYTPSRVAASNVSVKIGSRGDGGSNFFKGRIDEVSIFDRALSASEVQAVYSANSTDHVPPTVGINAPASGTTVTGTIAIDVTATDDVGIKKVELYKDNVLFKTLGAAPFRFIWSTGLETNATHTVYARAFDAFNNTATAPVSYIVNNAAVSNKPNIVLLLTDDQRYDTLQYMPILQARLGNAIKFDNAYNAVPLCCPDRASLLSGQYSHNTKIYDNDPPTGGAPVFKDASTLATWLKSVGYRTGLFGKYMNSYVNISPYIPPGWDDWRAFVENNGNYVNYTLNENGTVNLYGATEADYSTNVVTDRAISFIQSTPANQPVFVYLTPFAPHSELGSSSSLPAPAPSDVGSFASLAPWRPISFNETDVSDKPLWIRNLLVLSAARIANIDLHRQREIESLQAVDRSIGRVLDELQATGRLNNTVFVFTSDNGQEWGEHRWANQKWCAYLECVKQPLWISVPGVSPRNEDNYVSMIDIAPTLAEFAGAKPVGRINGNSFLDVINTPTSPWKEDVYVEYLGAYPFGSQSIFRMVIKDTYSYVEYDNNDREFYNFATDPYQITNSINDPANAQIIAELKNRLDSLRND